MTCNSPMTIYVNKVENRISFKMKNGERNGEKDKND